MRLTEILHLINPYNSISSEDIKERISHIDYREDAVRDDIKKARKEIRNYQKEIQKKKEEEEKSFDIFS